MTNSSQYQKAGVNVEAGDALVDWLQKDQKKSIYQDRILSGIGGFASLFNIQFPEIKKPCLITCTDGVGTKVKLASKYSRYDGIGQDLVAMCVNDLICTGGVPLMFLDYYAVGKLDLSHAQAFLASVKKACEEAECALVGGETAEMPGVYNPPDFDCAGFAVGIVDQDQALGPKKVKVGDSVIAVESSGLHSNGFSLYRNLFEKDEEKFLDQLLTPTHLYVKMMKALMGQVDIHAAAHITGGGLENLPRVMPENTEMRLNSWEFPQIFKEVQKRSQMSEDEMHKTTNCGVGFAIILDPQSTTKALSIIQSLGFKAWDWGVIHQSTEAQPSWKINSGGLQ
jgi:phosphoribosylformylglycinamidine cyclo-ligase